MHAVNTPVSAPSIAPFDPGRIRSFVANRIDVESVASIGSTNHALLQRPIGLVPLQARLLVAREQTAGRGRRGRVWSSSIDASLTFSVALERLVGPDQAAPAGLPIAVGVSLARGLKQWVDDIALKWPNDLQRSQRKCAGILIETRRQAPIERIVIGIGLNLLAPPELAGSIAQPVAGLFDDRIMPPREQLAGVLALAVVDGWSAFAHDGLASFRDDWAARDALAGREVRVTEGSALLLEGVAEGIDAAGALQVRTAAGVRGVTVGDVSVRVAGRTGAGSC